MVDANVLGLSSLPLLVPEHAVEYEDQRCVVHRNDAGEDMAKKLVVVKHFFSF